MFTKTHVTNNTQKCYKNGTYKVRYEDGEESKGNISVMILFKVTYFLGMCITVLVYAMILSPLPVSSVPTNITFADGTGIVKSDLRLFSEPSKAEAPGDRISARFCVHMPYLDVKKLFLRYVSHNIQHHSSSS